MYLFYDILNAMSNCEEHIKNIQPREQIIIAYLINYLLIYMCGKYEEELSKLKQRVDNKLAASSTTSPKTKKQKNDLSSASFWWIEKNILKPRGSNRADLEKRINDVTVLQSYDNMVANRHFAAHGGFAHVTISVLDASHKHAVRLLTELDKIVS